MGVNFDSLPKILAIDFDGTLVNDEYPEIGAFRDEFVDLCKLWRSKGNKLILWTSRCDMFDRNYLTEAVKLCEYIGLEFDAVNENIQEVKELTGMDTRKVYADFYLDDRNLDLIEVQKYLKLKNKVCVCENQL